MASPESPAPSPFLMDRHFWEGRLAQMESVGRGLLLLPRQDLTNQLADVVEWRMKAHDGVRLWGLRGLSQFHPVAREMRVRQVAATELPQIDMETLAEGCGEFVFQVPAGRRLEDRVLDVLRVVQLALSTGDVETDRVRLVVGMEDGRRARPSDEFMIADRLLREGICTS